MFNSSQSLENKQWHVLLIYDLYRCLSIFLFLGIFYSASHPVLFKKLFFIILVSYFLCSLLFLCWGYQRKWPFNNQVIIAGTVDVIAVSIMLFLISDMKMGQGILLNVTIAALSILVPGRLTIFFASLASCLLLSGSFLVFMKDNAKDLDIFYSSGIYGAGFFATALTTWYLSNKARLSERLAQSRRDELAGMQRLNEYIVERLHSGIIYVDEKREVLLINSAARAFFGLTYPYSSLYLHDLSPILSEKFDQFIMKTRQKESRARMIIEEPYSQVHFFSIIVAGKPAVLLILEDMTHIAQEAQQLKLAALGRFSASIAHELRNPLGAIGHAAQLLGGQHSLSAEDQRLKELITNNCIRMNGIIKNVLQLSRRETAIPENYEIGPFLEQFKIDFCHANSCDLRIKIPKRKLFFFFDKSQLEQTLVILCENAIKHGVSEDGIAHIVISAKSVANKTSIVVSDSGQGVNPEYKDSIFEPFFTTLRNGTGMGLFIARDLCEINQARLRLMNTSSGCSFSITQNTENEWLL
ncbi:MAG: two-component sensor histidine kinase [Legionella sp.]|nr:MAG: two-component sensor histidine kinase [Legionella sp.]PJD99348.1 MAG: two-component sensor histidine kinase [Legionella sp.]